MRHCSHQRGKSGLTLWVQSISFLFFLTTQMKKLLKATRKKSPEPPPQQTIVLASPPHIAAVIAGFPPILGVLPEGEQRFLSNQRRAS